MIDDAAAADSGDIEMQIASIRRGLEGLPPDDPATEALSGLIEKYIEQLRLKDKAERYQNLGRVFSPAAPIDRLNLFAGRKQQLAAVMDAISQRGSHAVLFGERGVGKTSLASVLHEYVESLGQSVVAPNVTCDENDDYASIWKRVFDSLEVIEQRRLPGLAPRIEQVVRSAGDRLDEASLTPHRVRGVLEAIGTQTLLVVIVDEFDRVADRLGAQFASMVKLLSDHSVPATLVLVGVSETVSSLISEHESIERALSQVRVPRMSEDELRAIVDEGLDAVGMTIDPVARHCIVLLSQGLPHYTHLIALYAARNANARDSGEVRPDDVKASIDLAVRNAQETITATHHRAVMSARADSLYRQVALACALARVDERGYFTAGAVRAPMSAIMGKHYDIPAFAKHIKEFCSEERGSILARTGTRWNYRFRFRNPLLQPYIVMDGLAQGLIDDDTIARVQNGEGEADG